MPNRIMSLLSTEETAPTLRSTYGFRPLIAFRHSPAVLGELAEVTEDGAIVGHWLVDDNEKVFEAMRGKTVILAKGFDNALQSLRRVGAEVTVHPHETAAVALAKARMEDLIYL